MFISKWASKVSLEILGPYSIPLEPPPLPAKPIDLKALQVHQPRALCTL